MKTTLSRVLGALRLRVLFAAGLFAALVAFAGAPATAHASDEPIKIGLVATLSGSSAKSGEAITRGLALAIDEINSAGGVLGRKLELFPRDDESNPSKGLLAARELVQKEKVAALFGGLQTPVALAIVPFANKEQVPFIDPWAAGTPITKNGANPNFIFRVSAMDELVDVALVDYAMKKYAAKKPGLILINNPWGESNEKGLLAAMEAKGLPSAGVEKFEDKDVDVTPQLTRLKEAGADALFMVANVGPSSQVVKSLDRMGWDVPIVSHWGPAGGRFTELAGPSAAKVEFIQTFTFSGNDSPKAKAVFEALKAKYPEIKGLSDVTPAVGVANAYDAMHMLAMAIELAKSTEGPAIREGMYKIGEYEGLIKTYKTPFTPENQDALGPEDYIFTHFVGDEIVPLK